MKGVDSDGAGPRRDTGPVGPSRHRPHRTDDAQHPTTPDGRYFVVRGRLWRCTDPALDEEERVRLTRMLMDARREIGGIKRRGSGDLAAARSAVDRAKVALGERGPVWWDDGAPDYTRRMARTTPYADWYAALAAGGRD